MLIMNLINSTSIPSNDDQFNSTSNNNDSNNSSSSTPRNGEIQSLDLYPTNISNTVSNTSTADGSSRSFSATLWESENTITFQVNVNNHIIAKRAGKFCYFIFAKYV